MKRVLFFASFSLLYLFGLLSVWANSNYESPTETKKNYKEGYGISYEVKRRELAKERDTIKMRIETLKSKKLTAHENLMIAMGNSELYDGEFMGSKAGEKSSDEIKYMLELYETISNNLIKEEEKLKNVFESLDKLNKESKIEIFPMKKVYFYSFIEKKLMVEIKNENS